MCHRVWLESHILTQLNYAEEGKPLSLFDLDLEVPLTSE